MLGLPSSREFFFDHLGLSLAEMAVDVFFVTSGFLVAGSLVNRGEVIAFLWARALRIYPAIWVMLILTVFVLAPALTTLPPADYFASPKTHDYFVKCATLIGGVRYSLPGVFETIRFMASSTARCGRCRSSSGSIAISPPAGSCLPRRRPFA